MKQNDARFSLTCHRSLASSTPVGSLGRWRKTPRGIARVIEHVTKWVIRVNWRTSVTYVTAVCTSFRREIYVIYGAARSENPRHVYHFLPRVAWLEVSWSAELLPSHFKLHAACLQPPQVKETVKTKEVSRTFRTVFLDWRNKTTHCEDSIPPQDTAIKPSSAMSFLTK